MEYVKLGRSGLTVSRLCLGCMTYGVPDRGTHEWTLPEDESRPFIKRALELGIPFFDTPNSCSSRGSRGSSTRAMPLEPNAPSDSTQIRRRDAVAGAGLAPAPRSRRSADADFTALRSTLDRFPAIP